MRMFTKKSGGKYLYVLTYRVSKVSSARLASCSGGLKGSDKAKDKYLKDIAYLKRKSTE